MSKNKFEVGDVVQDKDTKEKFEIINIRRKDIDIKFYTLESEDNTTGEFYDMDFYHNFESVDE